LEDGADEASLNGEPLGFCEGGMSFPSRWRFDLGTTLALTLEICGTQDRARAEGVVVGCEPVSERLWSVTVFFVDAPAGLGKIRYPKIEVNGDLSMRP
jgi:hypothetical protein